MSRKAITLQQMEEALRDFTRWIQNKLAGCIAEPAAEGKSGWVLTTNGAGGRSWEYIPGVGEMPDGSVTTAALAEGSVTEEKLSDEAVTAAKLTDGAVAEAKLADGAVTPDKLSASTKARMFRPNLLDNWYFGNPVNQRGKTSYTAAGYTIDRWMATGAPSVAVNDGYLTFAATTGSAWLRQPMEVPATGTLTLSALAKSTGTVGAMSLRTDGANNVLRQAGIPIASDYQMVTFTFDVDVSALVDTLNVVFSGTAGASVDVLAVKLELGDTQTLAHQDADGNWVLNEIPNFAEQLARCQRYYLKVYSGDAGWDVANVTSSKYFVVRIPTPVTMRIAPSVVVNTDGQMAFNTTGGTWNSIDPTKFNVYLKSGVVVLCVSEANTGLTLTANASHLVRYLPSLSADL